MKEVRWGGVEWGACRVGLRRARVEWAAHGEHSLRHPHFVLSGENTELLQRNGGVVGPLRVLVHARIVDGSTDEDTGALRGCLEGLIGIEDRGERARGGHRRGAVES